MRHQNSLSRLRARLNQVRPPEVHLGSTTTNRTAAGLDYPLGLSALQYFGAVFAVLLTVFLIANPAIAADDGEMVEVTLSLWAAIVLGVVEGVTEYLPVSSTGHLLVTTELLGLGSTEEAEKALDTYAICIQAGAILAVFVLYRERIRQMVDGILGRSEEGRTVLFGVIVAFIPTAIIALSLIGFVRTRLFGLLPIGVAWLVGGIVILVLTSSGVLDRGGLELGQITARHAALIGIAQAIALWPGVSRSLVTIIAGVLVGLSLKAAVEFSFLLGLVTLGAATAKESLDNGGQLIDTFGWQTPAVGLVVAFVAAVLSVKLMVSWLQEKGLNVFGYYRIVIGVLALVVYGAESLAN